MIQAKQKDQHKNTRKTIAIVANSSWNIYNFRLNLIRQLRQEGFQVIVIAPIDEYIHYLNDSKLVKHIPLKQLTPHSKNPLKDLRLSLELYRIYRRYQPDLILHYTIKPNIYGSLAARWANIPSIATITGLGYTFLKKNWINQLVSRLYKVAFKKVSKVVFHNQDDLDHFVNKGLTVAEKCQVIPGSGVNINHFRPLPKPETGKFIFLFIGRLLHDKGILELVEAAKALKQLTQRSECWILGELAPQNPAAIPKAQVLEWMEKKYIRYFGKVRDVRAYIKQADVIVLPSYQEGMPRAILEAMAMGKPIITTNVAGCRDTVEHNQNGYLVPPRQVDPLIEAMLKVYQYAAEDLETLGSASRAFVFEKFSDNSVNASYLGLIHALLSLPISLETSDTITKLQI